MYDAYRNIEIRKPCKIGWSTMKPVENGRFCVNCQSNVHDFSEKADEEILKYFSDNVGTKTCGRFKEEQLTKLNSNFPKRDKSYLALKVSGLIVGASLSAVSCSQKTLYDRYVDSCGQTKIDIISELDSLEGQNILKGTVLEHGGEPLLFANILLPGTERGFTTDIHGKFEIPIENIQTDSIFVISYVGIPPVQYPTLEIVNKEVEITMADSGYLLGEVIIIRQPIHKRAWNWLKRPFRKKA